jgi:GTPase KRas protein
MFNTTQQKQIYNRIQYRSKMKANNTSKPEMEEMKIAVVGGGGVGKSALTLQFIQNVFVEEYDPTIEDFYRKHAKVDDIMCFLEILDTAGQEEYKALRDQYMRQSEGFMLVYSVIDRKSFEEIDEFYEQILRVKDRDSVPMVVVANKCDMESERTIMPQEAKDYVNRIKVPYIEASAMKRKNVDDSFNLVVRQVRQARKELSKITTDPVKKKKCLVL